MSGFQPTKSGEVVDQLEGFLFDLVTIASYSWSYIHAHVTSSVNVNLLQAAWYSFKLQIQVNETESPFICLHVCVFIYN